MKNSDLEKAKNEAIKKMGGTASAGKMIGISSQAVSQWKIVPIERVLQMEEATSGRILCSDIRPDIFPVCPHTSLPPASGKRKEKDSQNFCERIEVIAEGSSIDRLQFPRSEETEMADQSINRDRARRRKP